MAQATETQTLPLLPLTTGVVLPQMVVTVAVESEEASAALSAAKGNDGLVLLVPKTPDGRYARIGTVAKVEDSGQLPSGIEALVLRGLHRGVIGTGVAGTGPAVYVRVEPAPDPDEHSERALELAREYRATVESIVESRGVPQVAEFLRGISEPGAMADTSGYSPDLSFDQKVEILETLDVEARLTKVLEWAKDTLAEVTLKDKIRTNVSEGMEKTQREFFLRQQLQAIKKELGEDDDEDVVEVYRTKIEAAGMPDEIRKEVERELKRLERTSEQNPEHGYIRNYLDWMTELPWDKRSEDRLEINEARAVLDSDHTGLEEVKDRIIEYLAVRKLRSERGLGVA
ncbi:MAG: LON peptidase substrate-binding domain-containing protein, partial [Actinobacteria bacterium]|nr:LON peptidase substrate-binding domain-containing protein [Actinomycetota bacterium]